MSTKNSGKIIPTIKTITDKHISLVDEKVSNKEKEIMTI